MINQLNVLKNIDPEIYDAIKKEESRQEKNLELIASENAVSEAVLEAQGSLMTNKYAEGLPGKRYYGGCEFVDVAETLAIERAKSLFGAGHANVQPHSGSQANMGVYFSVLTPGDTFLAMDLSHGGHLTHGSPVNFSGKLFNPIFYGLNPDTGMIDLEIVRKLALEHKPKLILAGASAYSRTIDFAGFRKIADEIGAYFMVDMAHIAGLVAGGAHPSPIPHTHFTTTTTHKTLRGPRGGLILCQEEFAKDVDKTTFPFMQGGPLMHVIAAKAVALKEAAAPEFKTYQQQVVKNSKALCKAVAGHGFFIVSGGTDNHLFLVDLSKNAKTKDVDGYLAQKSLEKAGVTVSRTTVPGETRKPYYGSGVRIGTPTVTTRGMKEKEMAIIGEYVAEALFNVNDEKILNSIREKVENLCRDFPLYNK
ncbi:MAG: serine hydroxymethyltransferase [Spirochaetes bacterium GWF1_51_8]|nr:MAG: serine hydroxymethyltransferase [Spirochaetes bacterium GWF1_51_8]